LVIVMSLLAEPVKSMTNVVALARGDRHVLALDRLAHQPELRAHEQERRVGLVELEVVEARVRPVDEPEAVLARLDVQVGPGAPVDADEVAEERRRHAVDRVRRDRQVQLPVVGEEAVLDDQLDLVIVVRQHAVLHELALERIAQQVGAGQARVHVEARDPDRVVVVPERRGALRVLVLVEVLAPVVAALRGVLGEPRLGMAVALPLDVRAVQVRDGRDVARGQRLGRQGHDERRVDAQHVRLGDGAAARRKVVAPQDPRRPVLHRHERRARPRRLAQPAVAW